MTKKRNNPETIAIHGGDYRSDPATTAVADPPEIALAYDAASKPALVAFPSLIGT